MNERIRELMEEAVRFRLDVDSKEYEAQVSPEDLEVFAELLIRECIDIVGAGGEFASRPKLVEKLQEHFGVEE